MTGQQLLGIAFAVVMLGYQFWPGISSLAGKLRLPAIGGAKTNAVTRDQAIDALATVRDYLLKNGRGPSLDPALLKLGEIAHAVVDADFSIGTGGTTA